MLTCGNSDLDQELAGGIEPPTSRLQVGCAASCATPARPDQGTGIPQAIVSRIPQMSATVVLGLMIANRVIVSPACELGVTKA